jgi:methionyl-tRNA formyltransferase
VKIAILTSPHQWFVPYAESLLEVFSNAQLFFDHLNILDSFDVVFILSYHKIIPENYLNMHKHNLVIHASALPKGKGWAPLFWQILEGKNDIPFTLFEATSTIDDGAIYFQETLTLTGYELNNELRHKQANHTIQMCQKFINNYSILSKHKKDESETFYPKRTTKDSQLDIHKTIQEQFNLLRIINNEEYPAFFEINGHKYLIKIEEDTHENR